MRAVAVVFVVTGSLLLLLLFLSGGMPAESGGSSGVSVQPFAAMRPFAAVLLRLLFRPQLISVLLLVGSLWYYLKWVTERYTPVMRGYTLSKVTGYGQHLRDPPIERTVKFDRLPKAGRYEWKYATSSQFGYWAAKGPRDGMEDRMSVTRNVHANLTVYGLFDGHGGPAVATYLENTYSQSVMQRLVASQRVEENSKDFLEEISTLVTEEASRLDAILVKGSTGSNADSYDMCGSTLVSAILFANRYLFVANVGDSRAVLATPSGEALRVTTDHKPQLPLEKSRIEKAGGFVSWMGVWRVAGILATSRAFGDNHLKRQGVLTAIPDVFRFDLSQQPAAFLILASDGLWDAVPDTEAVTVARAVLRRESAFGGDSGGGGRMAVGAAALAAKALVDLALERVSMDNVSVLIILLPGADF